MGTATPIPVMRDVTRTFGIFWPEETPNPVTKDIESYPTEDVTVPAGTFPCRKVDAGGGATAWFCSGIVVKVVSALGTTTLTEVR